jgi:hypothetical protein
LNFHRVGLYVESVSEITYPDTSFPGSQKGPSNPTTSKVTTPVCGEVQLRTSAGESVQTSVSVTSQKRETVSPVGTLPSGDRIVPLKYAPRADPPGWKFLQT